MTNIQRKPAAFSWCQSINRSVTNIINGTNELTGNSQELVAGVGALQRYSAELAIVRRRSVTTQPWVCSVDGRSRLGHSWPESHWGTSLPTGNNHFFTTIATNAAVFGSERWKIRRRRRFGMNECYQKLSADEQEGTKSASSRWVLILTAVQRQLRTGSPSYPNVNLQGLQTASGRGKSAVGSGTGPPGASARLVVSKGGLLG